MIRWFFLMTCFTCALALSSTRQAIAQEESDPDRQQTESSETNQATSDTDAQDETPNIPSRDTTDDSDVNDQRDRDAQDQQGRYADDQDQGRRGRIREEDDSDSSDVQDNRQNDEELPEDDRASRSNDNEVDFGANVVSENGALRISGIDDGTIAARIGLRRNDQIVSIDGRRLATADEWNQAITRMRSRQDRIPLIVNRDGSQTTVYIEPQTIRGRFFQSRRPERVELGMMLAPGTTGGLIVRDVTGGIGDVIGLRPNDVILSVGGRTVRSTNQFERFFTGREFVGVDRVPVIVSRGGRRVTLYYQPDEWNEGDRVADRYVESDTWLGVSLDTRYRDAAVVREVVPDSPADHAGVRAGDQIVRMNGRLVRSPAHLTSLVDSRRPGEEIEMQVARRVSRTVYATLEGREEPRRQVLRPSWDGEGQVLPRRFRTVEPTDTFDPDSDRRGIRDRVGPGERGILDRLDADEIPDEPRLPR